MKQFTDHKFELAKALAVLLIGTLALPAMAQSKQKEAPVYAKGRILVEARPGLSDTDLAKLLSSQHGKGRKIGHSNLHIVDLPHGSEKAAVEKLRRNPGLKFAELDYRLEANYVTNDPLAGSQWHHAKIGSQSAWDFSLGSGIVIAILDTGVDSTHPDLAASIVPGYDVYINSPDTSDLCGHGTAVAGTAAAAANNALGVSGTAGGAKIMPVRIAFRDATDGKCYAYQSTIASGITWAADRGARVANVSFSNVPGSAAAKSASDYMRSKGGLVVVSAGNSGTDLGFTPQASMIIVSATDSSDLKASWSSFGSWVHLAAPGTGIYTTNRGGGYGGWNGTSFASPVVAGVVALMMAAKPNLSSAEIEKLLFQTSVDLGEPGRDIYYGYGRVNSAAATQAAANAVITVDSQAPSVTITSPSSSSTVSGLVSVQVSASDNVGVTRVELKANGSVVAIDTASPYAFSWDSKGVANGNASLVAVAYDAAGNVASSSTVNVNVSNSVPPPAPDTTAPLVSISNPVNGGKVSGNITITANASDNSGAAGITISIYVDGSLKAKGTGSTLSYNWNTRKVSAGLHTIQVIAQDAAGNQASSSIQVSK